MWFGSILGASDIQNLKEIHNGVSGVTFTGPEQKFAVNQKYISALKLHEFLLAGSKLSF